MSQKSLENLVFEMVEQLKNITIERENIGNIY